MNNLLGKCLLIVWKISEIISIPWMDCYGSAFEIVSLTFDDCTKLPCGISTGNFHELKIEFNPNSSPLAARNFRIEVLWKISDVYSNGIVLNSQCNINEGCPDYNSKQQTMNYTSLIHSPTKFSYGKGDLTYKAKNIFNDLLLCFTIPVYVIQDFKDNKHENCTENV